jgi:hypothetical protein
MTPARGKYFWNVFLSRFILGDTIHQVYADTATITPNGDLVFEIYYEGKLGPGICFAAGKWVSFWAASCIDGHPVCMEREDGA